jgi:hypothetical protein
MSRRGFNAMLSLCFLAVLAACGTGPAAEGPATTRGTGSTTVASSQAATTEAAPYETEVFRGKEVFFPRRRTSGLGPSALGHGKLVVDDEGCIRMKPLPQDPGLVPIWPSDYELDTEGDKIQFLDGKGKIVAQIGEEVSMGGGQVEVQRYVVDARMARELRERCPGGGYWVVTEGFVRMPRQG